MKKIILASTIILASCSKNDSLPIESKQQDVFIRIESVNQTGESNFSEVVNLKMK